MDESFGFVILFFFDLKFQTHRSNSISRYFLTSFNGLSFWQIFISGRRHWWNPSRSRI